MEAKDFVAALRAIADFYERNPQLPYYEGNMLVSCTKEQLLQVAQEAGTIQKDVDDEYFNLLKTFGSITIEFYCRREAICRRISKGMKTIPQQVIPARPREVIPEHIVEEFEWECPESLLKGKA